VPNTVVFYKVDSAYSPTHQSGKKWTDEYLANRLPVTPQNATLSDKDRRLPAFKDLFACA
jgi:dTDP-4-dehydrorhamnose 3,5-epimerase